MLSKNQVSLIHSLYLEKYRKKFNSFIAEGEKTVAELIQSHIQIEHVFTTPLFLQKHLPEIVSKGIPHTEIKQEELNKLSLLKTPNQVLAMAKMPEPVSMPEHPEEELLLMLDRIQDPGNLGTMMRMADWFGINHIICSENCVDQYNPKVVQASMGSFLRINLHYCNLRNFLSGAGSGCSVFGTFTSGRNIYETELPISALILIGNESSGISDELLSFIHHKISIPLYKDRKSGSRPESLNAALSAALVCSEFRRQHA